MKHATLQWTAFMVAIAGVSRATAQVSESQWVLQDSRGGFCIWYLASPATAKDLAPRDTPLAAAGTGAGLPAGLVRLLEDDRQFSNWIPAVVCIGLYGSAAVDGRVVAEGKANRPVVVVLSALAASAPAGVSTAEYYLADFRIGGPGLLGRAAETARVPAARVDVAMEKGEGDQDDLVNVKLDGTRISWSGHPFGTARVGTTRSMSFGYGTVKSGVSELSLRAEGHHVRDLIGGLRVEGKDELAKAMKSSPLRIVAGYEEGGRTELMFRRTSGK